MYSDCHEALTTIFKEDSKGPLTGDYMFSAERSQAAEQG